MEISHHLSFLLGWFLFAKVKVASLALPIRENYDSSWPTAKDKEKKKDYVPVIHSSQIERTRKPYEPILPMQLTSVDTKGKRIDTGITQDKRKYKLKRSQRATPSLS